MKNGTSLFKALLLWCLITFSFGCDQATKQLARENLKNEDQIGYFDDTFLLIYAENPGAFYGSGSRWKEPYKSLILIGLPVASLLVLLVYALRVRMLQSIAFGFIIGGGFGNVFDRIMHGKVVDFLNLGVGDFRTGIFNVADMAIVFGLGLLLAGFLVPKIKPHFVCWLAGEK